MSTRQRPLLVSTVRKRDFQNKTWKPHLSMLSYEKVHSESSQDGWGECSLCNGPKSCFLIKSENGEKSLFGLFCINKHRCSEIDFIFKFLYLYVYVFGVCIHMCGGQRSMCMYDMCVVCVYTHVWSTQKNEHAWICVWYTRTHMWRAEGDVKSCSIPLK